MDSKLFAISAKITKLKVHMCNQIIFIIIFLYLLSNKIHFNKSKKVVWYLQKLYLQIITEPKHLKGLGHTLLKEKHRVSCIFSVFFSCVFGGTKSIRGPQLNSPEIESSCTFKETSGKIYISDILDN